MKNAGTIILFLVSVLLFPGNSLEAEITLTSCNWKPYNGEDLPNFGFTCQIIQKAFERTGNTVRFTFLPWKRAMISAERGEYQGLFAAYLSKERARKFEPSNPYFKGPLVLCTLRNRKVRYHTLQDLKPYRIGVVRGYINSPEFDAADYLEKEAVTSDLMNLKKLLKGRVDLIVIDKYLALYNLKNEASLEAGVGEVRFLTPPLAENNLYILFSKAVDGYKKRVADFNKGLALIKKEGTYQKILVKYGFGEE